MKFYGVSILGVNVWGLTRKKINLIISDLIRKHQKGYICVSAVHLIMECQNNAELMNFVNRSTLNVSDGVPLVWILKRHGFPESERIYGPDLMLSLCKLAVKNRWSVFILGGALNQSSVVANKLKTKFSGLFIAGNLDTPLRQISLSQNSQIIKYISKVRPDLIFVGMGCPYQELWMGNNLNKIDHGIMIGVGAAFDFISGRVKQAPPRIQNSGLEWLFRLFQNPTHLWKRYTITNAFFVYKIIIRHILKVLLVTFLTTLSLVFTLLLLLIVCDSYLKLSNKGESNDFLNWTVENDTYSAAYIFWEKPYCLKNPKGCTRFEEYLLPYAVESFVPNGTAKCNRKTKILFLGDSFTVAPWTKLGESMQSVFSQKYADKYNSCVDLFRLASNGSGNDQQYLALINNVEKLRPDIVVWQFCFNDYYDNAKLALYNVKNNDLVKRGVWNNSLFLTGFLLQHVPNLKNTTVGKHLLLKSNTTDFFHNWPLSPTLQRNMLVYNTDKIKLFLQKTGHLSEKLNFTFYTTLAPLQCYVYQDRSCEVWAIEPHLSFKKILLNNSRFLDTDSPSAKFGLKQIINTRLGDYTDLFMSEADKNDPGLKHLSAYGNIVFGNILFNQFVFTK